MKERGQLIEYIRGEHVGPARPIPAPEIATFHGRDFLDQKPDRRGPLCWRPSAEEEELQEILYYQRETPHRKYGAGLLHPNPMPSDRAETADEVAVQNADTLGVELSAEEVDISPDTAETTEDDMNAAATEGTEEFEVTSPDVRHPSAIGITACVSLSAGARIRIRLPRARRFAWQDEDSLPFQLNGRYENCTRQWTDADGRPRDAVIWRRAPAVVPNAEVVLTEEDLLPGQPLRRLVMMPEGSPIALRVDAFSRRLQERKDTWIITVVLRNITAPSPDRRQHEDVLYQTYFEVAVEGGALERYPESQRPFEQLDADEQSLALLYRESATYAIGHGCAAGWDSDPGVQPQLVYADCLPAVELPSMTPDIKDSRGDRIQLSMKALAELPDDGKGPAWDAIRNLSKEYGAWINARRAEVPQLAPALKVVANRHLDDCQRCMDRIEGGISKLASDPRVRAAFKLANLAVLLQQVATKQVEKRPLEWDSSTKVVRVVGLHVSPWQLVTTNQTKEELGWWRAFQVAFLLMSVNGVSDDTSSEREVVDLIWFPTGGGKTEAYLGVVAFYLFFQRLTWQVGDHGPRRDGTNVLMRYTLRMLTTQQFQRAASLICAMEYIRRLGGSLDIPSIPGERFSLGLWIGGEGSPNNIKDANRQLGEFRSGRTAGNPLVIIECPWCRAQIGRSDGPKPKGLSDSMWNNIRIRGVTSVPSEGPMLHCSDSACEFGAEATARWLPIEVIDDRIYQRPPSLVIGTVDKLAMIAYRPAAGILFGRKVDNGKPVMANIPPGLIIQDELHLISGPLGTMYAFYEAIFERLCSYESKDGTVKPKIIASTATIRGAAEQTKALYARSELQFFPSPGLLMGDSFFGTYARDDSGGLQSGRLYLGIHAHDYGSILTTQVRIFSAALCRPYAFDADKRDAWWTLLAFYNSIRELGGAKTLFDSDIRSRLKFLFNREGFQKERRNLRIVEELTSRLSQAEIVGMLDRLAVVYDASSGVIDACLASNIIEVGVDIDRLSLMGVVGQPKTTAQYIQVTGRIGRRWWERPGLVLMIYNPSKSRDRSHFEQFHSYHRRLHERVEPTSATPFAVSAIQRAFAGAALAWARQQSAADVQMLYAYEAALDAAHSFLVERCKSVQPLEEHQRSIEALDRALKEFLAKWAMNPQEWEHFPPSVDGEYLVLWPGQFASYAQRKRGTVVASSMRQVDGSAELNISQAYATNPVA